MKNQVQIIKIFVLFLLVFSCKKETYDKPELGYDYYPVDIGSYVTYDVDSLYHNDFTGKVDTFRFLIKEKITETFIDNEGRTTYRLERYKKEYVDTVVYDMLPWVLKDVWFVNKTDQRAEKVEENVRFVKMVFPVEKGSKWNGNAFNNMDQWMYSFQYIDEEEMVGTMLLDSVTTILQKDDESIFDKQYYLEKYAKNIGLVYKEVIDIKGDQKLLTLPLMNRIVSGVRMKMVLVDHGKE